MKAKGIDIYSGLFRIKKLDQWNKLFRYYLSHRREWAGWVFRGQQCSEWGLKTRLERAAQDRFKIPYRDTLRIEDGLLRKFKRELHNYWDHTPEDDQKIECLSIMQHHGAPTRLLDCTYSFFVALFFALEKAEVDKTCAVWGFDANWLGEQARSAVPDAHLRHKWVTKEPKIVNQVVWHSPPLQIIYPDNPFRKNRRLAVQQGVFLVPGDVTRPFIQNLAAIAEPSEGKKHLFKLEIKCTKKLLIDSLNELYRMKLDADTLFPGLDGFARHLEMLISVPNAIWSEIAISPTSQVGQGGQSVKLDKNGLGTIANGKKDILDDNF